MKNKFITLVAVILAVMAVSCSKKTAETSVPAGGNYYYTTFAEAIIAADASGKAMVLDFYTDS